MIGARHVITRILNLRFLDQKMSYERDASACVRRDQAFALPLVRHPMTRRALSISLELNGIL
jgi:hypothetical protein